MFLNRSIRLRFVPCCVNERVVDVFACEVVIAIVFGDNIAAVIYVPGFKAIDFLFDTPAGRVVFVGDIAPVVRVLYLRCLCPLDEVHPAVNLHYISITSSAVELRKLENRGFFDTDQEKFLGERVFDLNGRDLDIRFELHSDRICPE